MATASTIASAIVWVMYKVDSNVMWWEDTIDPISLICV